MIFLPFLVLPPFFVLPTLRSVSVAVACRVTVAGARSVGFGSDAAKSPLGPVTAVTDNAVAPPEPMYENCTVRFFRHPLVDIRFPLTEIADVAAVTVLGVAASDTDPAACFGAFGACPLVPRAAGPATTHRAANPSATEVRSLRIVVLSSLSVLSRLSGIAPAGRAGLRDACR
jgi:hypothetical protein